MTLLEISDATLNEIYAFLGRVPLTAYDYQIRELARQKYYSDKGLSVPAIRDLPTYDV